ncbi:hypothetical protein BH10PSE6_BH10PSE6_07230 [soil metagenome]
MSCKEGPRTGLPSRRIRNVKWLAAVVLVPSTTGCGETKQGYGCNTGYGYGNGYSNGYSGNSYPSTTSYYPSGSGYYS